MYMHIVEHDWGVALIRQNDIALDLASLFAFAVRSLHSQRKRKRKNRFEINEILLRIQYCWGERARENAQ